MGRSATEKENVMELREKREYSLVHFCCLIMSTTKVTSTRKEFLYRSKKFCTKHVDLTALGKGKAVPLQAWSGPEGSRKLRFPDFMTTAQDGGKVVSLTHRPPLPTGNAPGTHFC